MRPAPLQRRAPWLWTAAAIIVIVSLLATAGPALAGWGAGASGAARAHSTDVPAPAAPTARLDARTVTLSWPAVTLPDGKPVGDYRVTRTVNGGTPVDLPACAGTAPTCTDAPVPVGSLGYAVTARLDPWATTGPATTVVVASPTLTLTNRAGALPATLTGIVTGAVPGAALSARLDDPVAGTVLAMTPTVVAAGPSTAVSVTLPAGTSLGAHTVHVRAGTEALSAPVTVAADGSPTALTWVTNRDGRPRKDDVVRLTFSGALDLASLAPTDPDGNVRVVVSVLDGAGPGGRDLLTVTGYGGVTVNLGEIDTGSTGFVVANVNYGATGTASTLVWSAAARTLTLTLGSESNSSTRTVSTKVNATFTPAASLRTSSGGLVAGTVTTNAVAF